MDSRLALDLFLLGVLAPPRFVCGLLLLGVLPLAPPRFVCGLLLLGVLPPRSGGGRVVLPPWRRRSQSPPATEQTPWPSPLPWPTLTLSKAKAPPWYGRDGFRARRRCASAPPAPALRCRRDLPPGVTGPARRPGAALSHRGCTHTRARAPPAFEPRCLSRGGLSRNLPGLPHTYDAQGWVLTSTMYHIPYSTALVIIS